MLAPVHSGAVEYPLLAGKTTIVGAGVVGIRMRVPATVEPGGFTATFTGTGPWFAGMEPETGACFIGDDVCMLYAQYGGGGYFQKHGFGGFMSESDVDAGLVDFYLISAGEIRLEMSFPGLPGETVLRAEALIDAGIQQLPRRCPLDQEPLCEEVRWGGVARTLPPQSFAASFAWSLDKRLTPIPRGASPCLIPNYYDRTSSTDPADYPWGCDIKPGVDPEDPEYGLFPPDSFPFYVGGGLGGMGRFAQSFNAYNDGKPTYAGFAVRRGGPTLDEWFGGGAFVWLTSSIPR